MNEDTMDYVSRTAVMLVMVIFATLVGIIGFGLGYLIAFFWSGGP